MALLIGILNAIGRSGRSGRSGGRYNDDDYLATENGGAILCEDGAFLMWEDWTLLTTESDSWILQENYEPILF